jgi:hypothetical protein
VKAAGLAALAGVLFAAPALAHRGHSSLSVVEIDPATRIVTVTHRMAAHDVEPALRVIAPRVQPNLDDPEAMAALVAHASRAFLLGDGTRRIALTHRATQLAGDDVRLTFVGRMPGPTTEVVVDSNILEDAWAAQENQVNVRRGKITRTVLFRPGSAAQRVSFG